MPSNSCNASGLLSLEKKMRRGFFQFDLLCTVFNWFFEVVFCFCLRLGYGFVPPMFMFTVKLVMSLIVDETVSVRVAVTTCPG